MAPRNHARPLDGTAEGRRARIPRAAARRRYACRAWPVGCGVNQPNTSIFPLGIGVSVDVSLFQLHRLYSALPCYRALRPHMYFYVHVHVHLCVRYEVYFAMWTYLLSSVLSEPLCSEGSPAHLARCGKYRGISNYSLVSLLHKLGIIKLYWGCK